MPRTARPVDALPEGLQAHQRRGRILARRRAQRDAVANLRHRVRQQGGARGASEAGRARPRARPSQARARDGPVHFRSNLAGRAVLPAQGRHNLQRAHRLYAAAVPALRLRRSRDAAAVQERAVQYLGALGKFPREYVSLAGSRQRYAHYRHRSRRLASRLRAEAHELPRPYVRVPRREAIVPGPAAALCGVQPAASRRTLGHAARPDAGARAVAGRRAHLLPRRSDRGRDRAESPDGARRVRQRWVSSASSSSSRRCRSSISAPKSNGR